MYNEMINELDEIIYKWSKNVIICSDFNAKSSMWNEKVDNKRGNLLINWTNTKDIRLLNKGKEPTCIRPQGSSIIDLTWITPDLINRINVWKVMTETETLSDHKYVYIEVKSMFNPNRNKVTSASQANVIKKMSKIAWRSTKFDEDKFIAALAWSCFQRDASLQFSSAEEASQ